VIDMRAPHRHTDNEYAVRRATCEAAARQLGLPALRDVADLESAPRRLPDEVARKRVRHVVTEDERVLRTVDLLRAGRVTEIGPLMTASHIKAHADQGFNAPYSFIATPGPGAMRLA
jgi:galactokinase